MKATSAWSSASTSTGARGYNARQGRGEWGALGRTRARGCGREGHAGRCLAGCLPSPAHGVAGYIERQWPRPPGIQAPDGLCGRYTVYHPDDPIRGGCIPLVRARKCGTFSHSLRPGACGRRCRIVLWVGPVVNLPGGVPAFCPGAGRPAAGR